MKDEKLQAMIDRGLEEIEKRRAEAEREALRQEEEKRLRQDAAWNAVMDATPEELRPYAVRSEINFRPTYGVPLSPGVLFQIPDALRVVAVYQYDPLRDFISVLYYDVISAESQDFERFERKDATLAVATAVKRGMK